MDNLTHSLVGLISAKAGLDRLSPHATAVCIISANAADADSFTLLFGDRWTVLQHHRGITHSIVGTIAIAVLVPVIALGIERIAAAARKRHTRIRFARLLIASLVAAATHPLMDWTNNYGVRPLLPWSGKWFYGDLVFIMDPYIWLLLGGVAFLLTSKTRLKTIGWATIGSLITTLVFLVAWRSREGSAAVKVASVVWIAGVLSLIFLRVFGAPKRAGRRIAGAALALLIIYWGGLALLHRLAYDNTLSIAGKVAAQRNEKVLRAAAMPMAATPFSWQSVAETDRATYRFTVGVGEFGDELNSNSFVRFEKPQGQAAQLVALAERDRRAQILLGFARFPVERVTDSDCVGATLVQIADLRYTEPGGSRGNFSANIPVDCLPR